MLFRTVSAAEHARGHPTYLLNMRDFIDTTPLEGFTYHPGTRHVYEAWVLTLGVGNTVRVIHQSTPDKDRWLFNHVEHGMHHVTIWRDTYEEIANEVLKWKLERRLGVR